MIFCPKQILKNQQDCSNMLEISNLTKNFSNLAVLKEVEFTVKQGMIAAVLGASGSGKTTLLRLIAGFLTPDAGQIKLDEKIIASKAKNIKPEQRGIGYVAQEGALFPHLTVAQNIGFGLPRAQRKDQKRIEELLQMVGLPSHYAQRPPQALSGGEQQRVALARALAPRPRLLLLDEPFSALDAGLRAETRAAVAKALEAENATAILVTHDQSEALSMGHMVGVMQQGVLAQWADPKTLYTNPLSPEIASFVGEAVFLPAQANGKEALCALGVVELSSPVAKGPVKLMLRPEQIKISSPQQGTKALVLQAAYYGHDAALSLRLCQNQMHKLKARVLGFEVPGIGTEIAICVQGPVVAFAGK